MREARGLTALRLLDALRAQPATRVELQIKLGLSKQAVYTNVRRLLDARLIESRGRARKGGRGVFATVFGVSKRLREAA